MALGRITRARRTTAALSVAALAAGTAVWSGVFPSYADHVPPPPSVGTNIPETYFGPPPSQSFSPGNDFLVGEQQLLRSGTIAREKQTITIPLYLGHTKKGENVWFILTDTSDERNANALGLNFSSKLNYVANDAMNKAKLRPDTSLRFNNFDIDFSPERTVVAGDAPNFFPPKTAEPGSVADNRYSPYVRINNAPGRPLYNAPVIAFDVDADEIDFCDGEVDHSVLHDRVIRICPKEESNGAGTVTMETTQIFSFAKPSSYISTEASDPIVAALDGGTFAPAIGTLQTGRDDSAFSAIERLFVIANGQTNANAPSGKVNPQRQGLNSTLRGDGAPLHVIGGVPNVANDYSPAWDMNLGFWTDQAIRLGYRSRLIDEFQLLDFVQDGWLTGENGKPFGSTGIVVNCPIVDRLL
ncbi:MAG: hypothetical protein H0W56_04125 [Acidothermales bacterium]|nr:hypothetical protein [Acidothermales bacterium]